MTENDNMALPSGKTCSDCAHLRRCKGIYGIKGHETSCDWAPSRFFERKEATDEK